MIKKKIAHVKRRVVKTNEYGTEVTSFDNLGKIGGYLDYASISKGEIADKVVEDTTHIFISKTMMGVRQGDRLIIDEVEYEVNFVDRPLMGKMANIELKQTLQQNDMLDSYIYYGVTEDSDLSEVAILKSDNEQFKERVFSKEITGEGSFVFVAYPKSFRKASIRLNHRPVVDLEIKELMINGVLHYVYVIGVEDITSYIELF